MYLDDPKLIGAVRLMSLALFSIPKVNDLSNLKLLERTGSRGAKRQWGEKQRQKEAQNCGKRSKSSCRGEEAFILPRRAIAMVWGSI
jgi:hypothetical protein